MALISGKEKSKQIYSNCGYLLEEMPLGVREWDCSSCGTHHDRDINAAKNIKKQARSIA